MKDILCVYRKYILSHTKEFPNEYTLKLLATSNSSSGKFLSLKPVSSVFDMVNKTKQLEFVSYQFVMLY